MLEIPNTAVVGDASGNAGTVHNPGEQNNTGRGARNNPSKKSLIRGCDTQFYTVSRSYEGSTL